MTAQFRAHQRTDTGCREENQDRILLLQKPDGIGGYILLAAVADGAGGFGEGAKASQALMTEVHRWFAQVSAEELLGPRGLLMNAVDTKLKEIHHLLLRKAEEENIRYGSTLTMLLIAQEKHYLVAQVGDSRMYLYENAQVRKVTKDQTVAQKEKDLGRSIPCSSNKKSTLWQCFGSGDLSPKYYDGTLGDVAQILLCSDGQTNTLSMSEIREVLETEKTGAEKLDLLLRLARNKLEQDNISAILIEKTKREEA